MNCRELVFTGLVSVAKNRLERFQFQFFFFFFFFKKVLILVPNVKITPGFGG
jgi:hypothetical protein